MPSQYLYNPQSGMVPVQYTQGGANRSHTIPPHVTQEFVDVVFSPSTINLINSGFLKLAGPNSVVEQPQPPVSAKAVYRYGPWIANVRIDNGYLVSHNGGWWLCVVPHITVTAPSGGNSDFQLFSDLSASQFTGLTPTSGDVVLRNGSAWQAGKIGDANVTAISQSKITNLTTDLASKLSAAGGTMTGPIVLPNSAPGSTHAIRKDHADSLYLAKTGGTITGPILWAGTPTADGHLATKQYVDDHAGLQTSGGTMTGLLALSAINPGASHAIRKDFADATYIAKAGGTMTGPLTLTASEPTGLQAISKQHLDAFLAAGFVSGAITWSGTPTLATHLTTKGYVDAINISGKVITTPITWTGGTPVAADQLAPKSYVDLHIRSDGGTFTGAPIWATSPTLDGHLTNKQYVDTMLPKAGGIVTGAIQWAGTPTDPTDLVTKGYVDTVGANNGLVKSVDGFGTRWVLLNGVLDNILEIGGTTAPGLLKLFRGVYNVNISAPSLTANRTLSLPDAAGTIVLGGGEGAGAGFATAIGAKKINPATFSLASGGVINTVSLNTVGFTPNTSAATYLVELGANDGWNATFRTAPNAKVKFRLPHGTISSLNGIATAASPSTAMSTATVIARSTGFGAVWNGWELITTTAGASTGPIVVTVADTSVAASLTTSSSDSNDDVTVTAVVAGDIGNQIQYEQVGPISGQYTTLAVQSGTVDEPIISVTLGAKARMSISGSLNDGVGAFAPAPHLCVVGTLKNGRVWYTSNGLSTGYTSEIFWNSGTSRWNFTKGGFGTWLGASGVPGDVADPSLTTFTANAPVTGTPTITALSSSASQVVASFTAGGIAAATCALAPSNNGTGAAEPTSLSNLENGETLGAVTAKYFAADNHTIADLVAALAAAKAPIQLIPTGTGTVTSLTLVLAGGSGIEPSFGNAWSSLEVQFSSVTSSYIAA